MTNEKAERCDVCKIRTFERNNYFHGKLMTAQDFRDEQGYHNEKRWLINRMVLGWGVVCGLNVEHTRDSKILRVTPGLAIDRCGREIPVCEHLEIPVIPDADRSDSGEQDHYRAICLMYGESKKGKVPGLPARSDENQMEYTRIRESAKIVSISLDDIRESRREPFCPEIKEHKLESLHTYICERIRSTCPDTTNPSCVILAIVHVDAKGQVVNHEGAINTCSHRRIVYTNPLLHDMMACFHADLPHVVDVNWKRGDGRVNGVQIPWEEVWEKEENRRSGHFIGIYQDGLKVVFDHEMDPATITHETFHVSVRVMEKDEGTFRYERVPGEVQYDEKKTAEFRISRKWLTDAYKSHTQISREGGHFMVVLKGDFILSKKHAKALDGNLIGGRLPSGNGMQGGDFVSWFTVERRHRG